MKTLSKINEITHWGKAILRSQSDTVRKEDDPTQVIKDFMSRNNIKESQYTILRNKSVIVNANILIEKEDCTDGKLPFKFVKVIGNFTCGGCGLKTLEGCPKKVSGFFNCSHNELTSLDGCPEEVGTWFSCAFNKLNTLNGCTKIINGTFNCSENELTSLEGWPIQVDGGYIDCSNNPKKFTVAEIQSVCKFNGKLLESL